MSKTRPDPKVLGQLIDPNIRDYVDGMIAQNNDAINRDLTMLRDAINMAHGLIKNAAGDLRARQNRVEELLSISKARADRLKELLELANRER